MMNDIVEKYRYLPRAIERRVRFGSDERLVLRPGLALTLFSNRSAREVTSASAKVLEQFLNFVPGVDLYFYDPPDVDSNPDGFGPFGRRKQLELIERMKSGILMDPDDGFGVAVYSTGDGQAQEYGFQLGVIDLPEVQASIDPDVGGETSLLRVELPWDIFASKGGESVLNFFLSAAESFPYCAGIAGFSFLYTIGFATAARDEVRALAKRFIGFDTSYSSMQLIMRGQLPPVSWISFVGSEALDRLGGLPAMESAIGAGHFASQGAGRISIRAAKYPPVGDVNRGATDLGYLPDVARALKGARFRDWDYTGFSDEEDGVGWLSRFDTLKSMNWDNAV